MRSPRVHSLIIPLLLGILTIVGCNPSPGGNNANTGDNNTGDNGNNGSSASSELVAVPTVRKVMARAYLDGSASYQSISSYQWQQTAGTTVTLTDPTSARTEFALPTVASAELLTFELTVTGAGGNSHSQLLTVEVTPEDTPSPLSKLVGPTVVGEALLFPEVDEIVVVHDMVKVGDYVYLSAEGYGVRYVNVADPQAPEVVGTIGAIDRARGLSLNDDGDVLYIADHDGLRVVDVSDPGQPEVLTSLLSVVVDHDAYAVQASGDRLYAAGEDLVIYDVTDPASPVIEARYTLPFDNTVITGFQMVDNLAYVLPAYGGLRIFEINGSEELSLVGSYSVDDLVYDFWMTDQYAYLATDDQGVLVADISDPSSPGYVGSMTENNSLYPGRAESVEVFGDVAYVGSGSALQAWDITTPAQPAFLGEVGSRAEALTVEGQFAYIASGAFVSVVDISRPESLPVVGEQSELSDLNDSATGGFIRLGDTLEVVNGDNPASLTAVATAFDTQSVNYSFVENDRLYLLGAELRVFDVSNISSPSLMDTYSLDEVNLQFVYVNFIVDVDGDRLFFIDTANQVTILDFSDADNLAVIKPDFKGEGYQFLAVEGNTAFVTENNGQTFSTVNFSDPDNLSEIASIEVTNRDYVSLGGKAVRSGDNLIIGGRLTSWGDGLVVIDVSNPTAPALKAYAREMDTQSNNLAVLGDLAFLTEGQNLSGYIMVYDLSDPAHPAYTSLTPEGRSSYAAKAAGNTLLINNDWKINQIKTHVVDISSLNP